MKSNSNKCGGGLLPVVQLSLFPEETRKGKTIYVKDREIWQKLWKSFQLRDKGELPEIDFENQTIVVVKNTNFLNRIRVTGARRVDGRLVVDFSETRSARPIRQEVYAVMFAVPKE